MIINCHCNEEEQFICTPCKLGVSEVAELKSKLNIAIATLNLSSTILLEFSSIGKIEGVRHAINEALKKIKD
jgi:hypothetical protein